MTDERIKNLAEPENPQWDAANPTESFCHYAEHLHQKAKWTFLKDKTHVEIIFAIRPTGEGIIMLVRGDRNEFVEKLKALIQESDITGIVHIAEAWARFGGEKDHITRQIMWGEMAISDLKPEHRMEALVVSVQARDGQSFCWIDPIVRDAKTGNVNFGEGFKLEKVEGRFGRLFG